MTKLCDAYCRLLDKQQMLQLYIQILSHISRTFAVAPSVCPECEEIWKIKIDQVYGNSNPPKALDLR